MKNRREGLQKSGDKKQSQKDLKQTMRRIWINLRYIGKWAYKLRSILLAIPVGIAAVSLAIRNMAKLPEQVGINLQASGEYAMTVGRGIAVMGPLAVTAVCLLLMFCSRRVVYPWLISLFSLTLPLLIWLTNTFPY